ncbi:site-specific tyrosine recombinase XerD [Streptococcus hyovaginalis]
MNLLRITILSQNLKTFIAPFLSTKAISEASRLAYGYDLEQFVDLIEADITEARLLYYQEYLKSLKVSAQKRKQSSVNQFLLYLYNQGILDRYYRLQKVTKDEVSAPRVTSLSLAFLEEPTPEVSGRLIASLIALGGLTIKEIAALEWDKLDIDFKVLTVERAGQIRVLNLPDLILEQLSPDAQARFVFDNGGKPYSRQWFFIHLKAYLAHFNLGHVTAQDLRKQYILAQKASGKTISDVAKQLGLKSTQTLEKYFNEWI